MKIQGRNIQTIKRDTNVVPVHSIYGDALLFGRYQQIDPLLLSAVYAAVELISNSIASMPIQVKQYTKGENTIIRNHAIVQLFNHLRQTRFVFIK